MNNVHLAKKTSKKVTFSGVQQKKPQPPKTQSHLDFTSFLSIQPKQPQQSQHPKQQQLPILTKIQPQKVLNFNQFPLYSEQTDEDDEIKSTSSTRKIEKTNGEGLPKKKVKLTEQDEKLAKPNQHFLNLPLFSIPNLNPKSSPLLFGINQNISNVSNVKQSDKITQNQKYQSFPFFTNATIPSILKPPTNPITATLPFPMIVSSLPFQNTAKPPETTSQLFSQNHNSIFPISKATPLFPVSNTKENNIPIAPMAPIAPIVPLAPFVPLVQPSLPSILPPLPFQPICQQTYISNQSQVYQNISPTNLAPTIPQIIMNEEEEKTVQREVSKIKVNLQSFLQNCDHSLHQSHDLLADCKLEFSKLVKMTNLNKQLKIKAIAQQRQINCLTNQSQNLQSEIEFLKQFCKTIKPKSITESQELLQLLSDNQLGMKLNQIMKNPNLQQEVLPKPFEVELYYTSNLIERTEKLMDLLNLTFDQLTL